MLFLNCNLARIIKNSRTIQIVTYILTNSTSFIIKILYFISSLHFLSTGTESERKWLLSDMHHKRN